MARDSSALDYLPQPPRLGYSRTASLREILVRAKLPPNRKKRDVNRGFKKCNRRADCAVCCHSENTSVHMCNCTKQKYKIKSSVSCTSTNIIYCLSCTKSSGECCHCGPQYIGCTERMSKTRFAEHIGSASQPS